MRQFRRTRSAWLIAFAIVAGWLALGGDSFGAFSPSTPTPQCSMTGTPEPGAVDVEAMGCQPAGVGTPLVGAKLTVTLSLSSDRAAPQNIVVRILDANGSSVDDATVMLINRHLEMDHGDFVRKLVHDSDGRYLGEKVGMGMGGRWQTEIQVSRPGQPTTTFIFAVLLKGI